LASALLDVAPVLADADLSDDGNRELGYVLHLVFDEGFDFF
jgi:hypothetical protein